LKKRPLLQVLVDLLPNRTRDELYAQILCGDVMINGERLRDPKHPIALDSSIEFAPQQYVSRGGVKLAYALQHTDFPVEDKVMLDAGSSTGGFTDCLLQHGAKQVYAVDVGTNQLAYALRVNPKVTVFEKTNIMAAGPFSPRPQSAVADISFRSLRKAAFRILDLTSEEEALLLAKPQFEWDENDNNFDGILRDTSDIRKALLRLIEDLAREQVHVHSVVPSPIKGRKGNREFFLLVRKQQAHTPEHVSNLVDGAVQPL
jgi:23S rRNA (cytidine1920-2'-O)/16S rRNA (cytidine1409-2'-O)-methyltransferase